MARAREIRGLRCDEPFRTGAGKIIWTRFEELMGFRDAVLRPESPEAAIDAVHDMRVASRRLRASLEVFSDVFPRKSFRFMLTNVKALADVLGGVRDMDVMIERLQRARSTRTPSQKDALDAIIQDMQNQRMAARRQLEHTMARMERTDFPRRFAVFVAQETV